MNIKRTPKEVKKRDEEGGQEKGKKRKYHEKEGKEKKKRSISHTQTKSKVFFLPIFLPLSMQASWTVVVGVVAVVVAGIAWRRLQSPPPPKVCAHTSECVCVLIMFKMECLEACEREGEKKNRSKGASERRRGEKKERVSSVIIIFLQDILPHAVELRLKHPGGASKGVLGEESQADVEDFDYTLGAEVSFATLLEVEKAKERREEFMQEEGCPGLDAVDQEGSGSSSAFALALFSFPLAPSFLFGSLPPCLHFFSSLTFLSLFLSLSLPLCLSLSHTHTYTLSLSLSFSLSHTHTHTHSLSISLSPLSPFIPLPLSIRPSPCLLLTLLTGIAAVLFSSQCPPAPPRMM